MRGLGEAADFWGVALLHIRLRKFLAMIAIAALVIGVTVSQLLIGSKPLDVGVLTLSLVGNAISFALATWIALKLHSNGW